AGETAEGFLEDILHGDEAGGAAEFIEHNGDAALLALEAAEELKEIHRLRDEGRKLDDLFEIGIWIEEEGAGVKDADDGVGGFVVNGNAGVFDASGGLEHFLVAEIIGDAGDLGAGIHDVAGGALIEGEDFE